MAGVILRWSHKKCVVDDRPKAGGQSLRVGWGKPQTGERHIDDEIIGEL